MQEVAATLPDKNIHVVGTQTTACTHKVGFAATEASTKTHTNWCSRHNPAAINTSKLKVGR